MNQSLNLKNVFLKEAEDSLRCYKSQISDFPGPRLTGAIEVLTIFRGTQAGFHVARVVS